MSRRLVPPLFAALVFAFAFVAPALAQRDPFSPELQAEISARWPEANKTITGIRYVIHQEGTGEPARSGDLLSVYYKGALMNGTVFNDCHAPDKPFQFRLGRGLVIDAWDQAFRMMREGSKFTLIIPYELAYGTRGNPPLVPRMANLVFDVEIVKIERGPSPVPVSAPADEKKKKK